MLSLPKILALDLDGTLLRPDHSVSDRTKRALSALMKKGCLPVISTGRSYGGVLPILEQLKLNIPAICYNGAAVYDSQGKIVKEWLLPEKALRQVIEVARRRTIHLQGFHNEQVYAERQGVETEYYLNATGLNTHIVNFDSWSELNMNKVILIGPWDRENQSWPELSHSQEELKKLLGDKIYTAFSKPFYLEVISGQCSKGVALDWLRKEKGWSKHQTAAMGDGMNDAEMLQAAGTSVAMANADEDLLPFSTHKTASCQEDGVAQFIEKHYLS